MFTARSATRPGPRDLAQTAPEALISGSTLVAEIGAKGTGDALRPLGVQVAETLAKLNRPPRPWPRYFKTRRLEISYTLLTKPR
jgi:hypothetical protein